MAEVIWKIIATIINTRIRASISLQNALHGFWKDRGAGTAKLEAKLDQHLAGIYHKPLLHLLLNMEEAFRGTALA